MKRYAKTGRWGGSIISSEELDDIEFEMITGANNNDYREPSYLESIDNRIYFYGEVDRHRILQLNKKIRDLNIVIATDNARWTIETTPRIFLHINSKGGEIFSGLSGMDEVLKSAAPVVTIVDGCCASAATLISLAGTERCINKNAHMLIHQLSSGMWGTYAELKDEVGNLDTLMEKITNIYKTYTKIPNDVLENMLSRNLLLDAEKCLEYGLVDKILV